MKKKLSLLESMFTSWGVAVLATSVYVGYCMSGAFEYIYTQSNNLIGLGCGVLCYLVCMLLVWQWKNKELEKSNKEKSEKDTQLKGW